VASLGEAAYDVPPSSVSFPIAGRNPASVAGLGRFAALHPAAERLDAIRIPRPVAGHRPAFELVEDSVRIRTDVVVRPEVEMGGHRSAVALPEERLDVALEAHRLSCHDAPSYADSDSSDFISSRAA